MAPHNAQCSREGREEAIGVRGSCRQNDKTGALPNWESAFVQKASVGREQNTILGSSGTPYRFVRSSEDPGIVNRLGVPAHPAERLHKLGIHVLIREEF